MLQAEQVSLGYGDRLVVSGLDLAIDAGAVTTLIGPNGCGKSTTLRGLGRLLPRRKGIVTLDGRPLEEYGQREVARRLAVLPQSPGSPEGMTVAELVARGRRPHQSWLRQWSAQDESAVVDALELTGTTELAGRPVTELSGGQRQRAWLAMVLAQHTDVLLLDEPTTFLDLAHAVEVLDLVDVLNDTLGRTVVMVLHDLNLAARYSDRLVVMEAGRIVAEGAPAEVLDRTLLETVFGLRAEVVDDPLTGGPLVVPRGTRRLSGQRSGQRPARS